MASDLIVIGAGAAGLMAAMRAAAGGLEVTLLEANDGLDADFARGGGGVSAAGTRFQDEAGISDSPDLWARDIAAKTDGDFDPLVGRLVTVRARDAVHFLSDQGIPIRLANGIPVVGHSAPRMHVTPSENGLEFARLMAAAAVRPSITRHDNSPVIGLLRDGDRVSGVVARIGGDERQLHAPFVLLACGGFAANREMVRAFIPEVSDAIHIGCRSNEGSGIEWARALGAATAFMDSYQGHGHVTADGKGRLGFGLTSLGAILVNAEGRRFVREDIGPSELAAHVLAQPGGTAVEIYDQDAHEKGQQLAAYRSVVASGQARRADTPEELAALFGLPLGQLAETLAGYGKAMRGEAADPLHRTLYGRELLFPLWGTRITGALAHTQGGVRINADCEILREDGSVIPGLLGAGGTVVGISGRGAAGYSSGNGLAQAFALGLIAAETAARKI